VLTNLPALPHEYSFQLFTLEQNSVSNVVAFAVTNFTHRLGPYTVTDLGTLGGTQTMALAINKLGQAIGKSRNATDKDRAVLSENGGIRDLSTRRGSESRLRLQ
jgi:probable HAF family extracellular repeat protein